MKTVWKHLGFSSLDLFTTRETVSIHLTITMNTST